MPSKVRSRYGGFMCLTEKKREVLLHLSREKKTWKSRENLESSFRPPSSRAFLVEYRKVYSGRREADVVMSSANHFRCAKSTRLSALIVWSAHNPQGWRQHEAIFADVWCCRIANLIRPRRSGPLSDA
jgi:hypothetical protein